MTQEKTISIFLNYRRDDCLEEARQIRQLLQQAFGDQAIIFFDEKSIKLTEQWKQKIREGLAKTEVMLSLIGPNWMSSFQNRVTNEGTQYINDWVQFEIEFALEQRIDVVPVFLYLDNYPQREELPTTFPEQVAAILARQVVYIQRGQLRAKVAELVRSLSVLIGVQLEEREKINLTIELPPLASLPLDEKKYLGRIYELDEQGEPRINIPFLGPVFYSDAEAALYFGREQEIRELYHLIRRNKLVLLHGYSGAGKSSLLHAGLLPRMYDIAHWEVLRPLRRNKVEGGLAKQLEVCWNNYQEKSSGKELLIVLDQVEEMYVDPLVVEKAEMEVQQLGQLIRKMVEEEPGLHLVLSFRSEYLSKVANEFLYGHGLYHSWDKMYLPALSTVGIKMAVKAPMRKQLQRKFDYQIEENLVERLAKDYSGKDDFSPYTVLLQIQLVELWKAAQLKSQTPGQETIKFTEELYEECQKKDLASFIEGAIEDLCNESEYWREAQDKGLLLDVLYRFTTAKGTATSIQNDHFKHLYAHLEKPNAEEIIKRFKQKYLLSTSSTKARATRLAHDTLAPIIRAKFERSDSAGIRAWRLMEAKRSDIELERMFRFSESDAKALIYGRYAMPALPDVFWQKVEEDLTAHRKQRQRNFKLAYSAAQQDFEDFKLAGAISHLATAYQEGIEQKKVLDAVTAISYPAVFLKQKANLKELLEFIAATPVSSKAYWSKLNDLADRLPKENIFLELEDWLRQNDQLLYQRMRQRFFPKFVEIPGGSFVMGAAESTTANPDERPAHQVVLSPYQLADTPVTFWQYGLYCLHSGIEIPRDAGFGQGEHPVVNVNWFESIAYANWLSKQLGLQPVYELSGLTSGPAEWSDAVKDWKGVTNWQANGIRLPTEAEWEFAAGGGIKNRTLFSNGSNQADPKSMNFDSSSHSNVKYAIPQGWMDKLDARNFKNASTPVKYYNQHNQNSFGLYDMSGNVNEWCYDWYSEEDYYKESKMSGDVTDPIGPDKGERRVVRGGSWFAHAMACRSSSRDRIVPIYPNDDAGFRVARRKNSK